jgi:hypothetical protein
MTEAANSTTNASQSVPHYLTKPLAHIGAWTQYFVTAEIPVLSATAKALAALREIEDDVDPNMLTAVIQSDPLMTLKLFARMAQVRRPNGATETESITASLVLMGIGPFFRHFGDQPTVEDWLKEQPRALDALQVLLTRAERAGQFALGFAVHRGDTDAAVIHLAAFLNDFAEMLVWLHAPTLVIQIKDAQKADSTLRSNLIQREVLGMEFNDLRQSLMKLWHLPELLIYLSDDRHAERAIVRNVLLAVRLARHTSQDWDNAALPDDIQDISQLLNASPRATLAFLHKIDHPMLQTAAIQGLTAAPSTAEQAPEDAQDTLPMSSEEEAAEQKF